MGFGWFWDHENGQLASFTRVEVLRRHGRRSSILPGSQTDRNREVVADKPV